MKAFEWEKKQGIDGPERPDGPDLSDYEILQRLDSLVTRKRLGLSRDDFMLRSFDDSFDLDTDDDVEPDIFWCNLYQAAYSICSADVAIPLEEFEFELLIDAGRRGPIAGYMALLHCGLGHGRSFDLTTIMVASFDDKAQAALQHISMRRGIELLGPVYTMPIAARNPPVRFGRLAFETANIIFLSARQADGDILGDDSILPAYKDARGKVLARLEEQERRLRALVTKVLRCIHLCEAVRTGAEVNAVSPGALHTAHVRV